MQQQTPPNYTKVYDNGTLTVEPALSATASPGTINCNGGSTTLTVTASGGTGALQYSLNGGL